MPTRARTFEYDVSLDRGWTARSSKGGIAIPNEEEEWTPEHLVLAGLCRCTLTSFRHHARRAGLEPVASASAHGVVTRREEDGRFAFVEVAVALHVTLEPAPAPAAVRELIAKGERDCFVGASLTAKPDYRWTVNGEEIP
ncbi:OsmC-like protein [Gaiella occulta]|uniref:OsmC-like protein n=1 Tax=Gaiella occulta TaxID=1002870 RepID=A0A7M2Z0E3_9ACTN|nr:OsmC family protein [Gaiella occulta]RDI75751.1 OsmC-like protein [Gaiella occulta]